MSHAPGQAVGRAGREGRTLPLVAAEGGGGGRRAPDPPPGPLGALRVPAHCVLAVGCPVSLGGPRPGPERWGSPPLCASACASVSSLRSTSRRTSCPCTKTRSCLWQTSSPLTSSRPSKCPETAKAFRPPPGTATETVQEASQAPSGARGQLLVRSRPRVARRPQLTWLPVVSGSVQ